MKKTRPIYYYVDPRRGDDANPGSRRKPLRTMRQVAKLTRERKSFFPHGLVIHLMADDPVPIDGMILAPRAGLTIRGRIPKPRGWAKV